MKALVSSLFCGLITIGCATTGGPTENEAEKVFNSYCRNGKQIRKFEITFDIYQTKCPGETAIKAAAVHDALFNSYSEDKGEAFFVLYGANHNFQIDSDDFFRQFNQKSWCDAEKTDFYRLDDGRLVLGMESIGDRDTQTSFFHMDTYDMPEKKMFNTYIFPDDFMKQEEEDGMTMKEYLKDDPTFWKLVRTWKDNPNRIKTSATAIKNGHRYSVSYDLNDFCGNAIPREDLMAK